MQLIDSHCHIHDKKFFGENREAVYSRARNMDIGMLLVGTSEQDSVEAVRFAMTHDATWAVVGVHPHDSQNGWSHVKNLLDNTNDKIVGIGEIGLDYFYDNSPRDVQIEAFEAQLQLAKDYVLPVSFHVRDAFDDFWPILANFPNIKGVLHSYTDDEKNLEIALSKGMSIGINGISTFAADKQTLFDSVPLENILLETDSPFLTPVPHRGTINEPAFVRNVAEYHAKRRQMPLDHLSRVTSANARALFALY